MADFGQLSSKVYVGASTDVKPAVALIGAECHETDTSDIYTTFNGTAWTLTGSSAVSVDLSDVTAKTDNLPSDLADASVIAGLFTDIKGAGWAGGASETLVSMSSDLDLIKNKDGNTTFTRATDSLEAISEAIAAISGGPGGSSEYDGVYVDTDNGDTIANGATGSPNKPFSTIAEAITTAETNKVQRIYFMDANENGITLGQDLDISYTFIGIGGMYNTGAFDNNSHINSKSVFINMYVKGVMPYIVECHNCYMEIEGRVWAFDCVVNGITLTGPSEFDNCSIPDAAVVGNSNLGTVSFRGLKGKATLTNLGENSEYIIYGNSLDLTIDATCTAGTINIYGSCKVTNNTIAANESGTHTEAAPSATVLTDSGATFTPGALVGLRVSNTTDSSSGIITANDGTTVTVAELTGGGLNVWTLGDAYTIIGCTVNDYSIESKLDAILAIVQPA